MGTAFLVGLALWAAGTLCIRVSGNALARLFASVRTTVLVYAISFLISGILVPIVCLLLRLDSSARVEGAALLALPTLLIDAFSCVFFARLFPRAPSTLAGVFGGWMMICCAGGVVGAIVLR